MKFFSKMNANLMIVLKQGLPGNAQLGTTTTPGLYARFQNGVIDVTDEAMVKMMLAHPGMNVDYIQVEDEKVDPFLDIRKSNEPAHVISNMQNGHPERVTNPKEISPELKAYLMDMAKELAKPMAIELSKQMLPSLVQETMRDLADRQAQATNNTDIPQPAPRKGGRPKKVTETPV